MTVAAVAELPALLEAMLMELHHNVGFDRWVITRSGDDHAAILAETGALNSETARHGQWWTPGAKTQLPFVVADLASLDTASAARRWSGSERGACLAVAINALDGSALGVLGAVGAEPRGDLDCLVPTLQARADVIGMLLSFELRTADALRRAERSEAAALVDPLTGVANRRAWERALDAESARSARYGSPASVIVIDIEGLGQFNARHGHDAGDALLCQAATAMTDRCRSTDLVARLAGDEFAILLPEASFRNGLEVRDQISAMLADAGITVSVGTGSLRPGGDLHGAWRDADTVMCAHKLENRMTRLALPGSTAAPEGLEVVGGTSELGGADVLGSAEELDSVDALLCMAKDQLGMDIAFVSHFVGDDAQFPHVVSDLDGGLTAGSTTSRSDTYCQLLIDGTIDSVVPDAAVHPLLAALPATTRLRIGSFVGVPMQGRNGDLYGTLCVFSQRPDHSLRPRDAHVLNVIAGVIMTLIEHQQPRRSDSAEDHHGFLSRLDDLFGNGGPDIAFQPIVNLARRQVVGMEALSRFPADSPNPLEWFAAAEQAAVSTKLQLRAITNAVAQLGAVPGFLAVNASPAAACTPSFMRQVDELPLHRLVLELTELTSIDNERHLKAALGPLRERGLRLAIDDVGTGYSNMHRILTLSPDLLKLDASLVHHVDTDPARQALVAALTTFAADTGAEVIAEGIETQGELEYLQSIQVPYGQGYLLGRPGPLEVRLSGRYVT